jgi:DNA gyrase/topoisomerase IV subunit B
MLQVNGIYLGTASSGTDKEYMTILTLKGKMLGKFEGLSLMH